MADASHGHQPDDEFIEDSPTGMRSARAAGLRVVGVPPDGVSFDADLLVERIDDPRVLAYLGVG